jgi:hypothetical protein
MKYTLEMTPEEFAAMMKTVRRVADSFATAALFRAERAAKGPRPPSFSDAPGAQDDSDTDTDTDAAPEDSGSDADVLPFTVVKNDPSPTVVVTPTMDEAAKTKAEEQRVKALHGKDMWVTLISVWRDGFGVEDAPQPDRVRNLTAALTPDTLAYVKGKAGLTDATREAIYLLDGGDPEAPPKLTNAQLREARLIAENIAQVASFHAPFIAERLEYTYEYHTLPTGD